MRISSLSNYHSRTFVLCSRDMKMKIEMALVRISSLCVQHMPEAHVPDQLPVFHLYLCIRIDMKIESKKAQVHISSLSNFQSFVSSCI